MDKKSAERHPNRLIFEKSPYLLQHAYNPVDWYPWTTEAFEKAKKQDKPVFLSIGYSTCHWCHVMEKESFEDPGVADALNETFVCIKVDREERPDIDSTFMRVCQMMTGSGGGPLTILMTPDKEPFFAATYLPRESRFGRVGMKELIPRVKEAWEMRRNELYGFAERILSVLRRGEDETGFDRTGELDETTLDEAYLYFSDHFDEQFGGFGPAPKFPSPHRLTFLLRYWKRTGKEGALRMVEKTLESMRLGGIYDHIGFGFHRYSTDRQWLVPHFEKMLYDQALLTIAYVEAYQATGREEYKEIVQQTITYVLRDMVAPEGGFSSAEDADVEGEEGKFYLWSEDEIRATLPQDAAGLVLKICNVEEGGNFEEQSTRRKTGKNILYLKEPFSRIANDLTIPLLELKTRWETARRRLFVMRSSRVHPSKDDKIMTDWNGLMIVALAKAFQAFNEVQYLNAAKDAVTFVVAKMRDSRGGLYHRYRDGEAGITGFLDDYAFLSWGLLELYESTFEVEYLSLAIALTDEMMTRFWDEDRGGFYFTAEKAESVLLRDKAVYDGAYPSGNSVAALNLLRIARMTGNSELEAKADQLFRAFAHSVKEAPTAHTSLMVALDFALGPSYELVIVGDKEGAETMEMRNALHRAFIPNKVVLFRPISGEHPEIARFAEFTRELTGQGGRTTAYVCRDYQCKLPTTSVTKMLQSLDAKTS